MAAGASSSRRQFSLHRQRGTSLLEALIALLVLSIGLLGIASLQLSGMRFNHEAYMRSQATLLSHQIIDAMRANRSAAIQGDYISDFEASFECGPVDLTGSVAEQDLLQWRQSLACSMPGGTGQVDRSGDIFSIVIRWEDNSNESSTFETFKTEVQF